MDVEGGDKYRLGEDIGLIMVDTRHQPKEFKIVMFGEISSLESFPQI